MNRFIQLRFLILVVGIFLDLNIHAADSAPKKNAQTVAGDKAYLKLKFSKAIARYTDALEQGGDTIYLQQRIAACYRALNDQVNAEKAYAQLANNSKASNINKYYYAELLRVDKNYASARKYYEQYATGSTNANIGKAIEQMDKIPALSIDNPAYKISSLGIESLRVRSNQ